MFYIIYILYVFVRVFASARVLACVKIKTLSWRLKEVAFLKPAQKEIDIDFFNPINTKNKEIMQHLTSQKELITFVSRYSLMQVTDIFLIKERSNQRTKEDTEIHFYLLLLSSA